jgi:hypothetical protein
VGRLRPPPERGSLPCAQEDLVPIENSKLILI